MKCTKNDFGDLPKMVPGQDHTGTIFRKSRKYMENHVFFGFAPQIFRIFSKKCIWGLGIRISGTHTSGFFRIFAFLVHILPENPAPDFRKP